MELERCLRDAHNIPELRMQKPGCSTEEGSEPVNPAKHGINTHEDGALTQPLQLQVTRSEVKTGVKEKTEGDAA